jgi:hypothetical protein
LRETIQSLSHPTFEMTRFGKTLILFSLFAILIASAAAQVSFLPASTRPQHAGCHQPASNTPTPVTYSCCQAGHDSLLLLNSDFVYCWAPVATSLQQAIPISVDDFFVSLSRYSASPPGDLSGPLPLRV